MACIVGLKHIINHIINRSCIFFYAGASKKSEGWVGLGCCELTIAVECRRECKLASSKNDISKVCRKDRETALYSCINRNESLYCCDRAEDTSCQTACKTILRTMTMENEIVDGLIEGCKKQPLPQDPLWQCFLESSRSPYPVTTVDTPPSPKLLCCSKANTTVCRPTGLFRSCNAQSDQGAMDDMKLWEKGSIKMPFMNIPVLDIRKCRPEMWKAVACSLQIKPCHSKSRGSVICKSDCVNILKHCGDQSKFSEGTSPETICDFLSPTDDAEYCIPLESYLSCKMGEASEFLVHQEALIQVPLSKGEVGCYKVCTCGQSGRLENCVEMPCVDMQKSCIVGGQRKGLPCNCADQFVPVCAHNGRTYPSACIARCVGLQDNQFEFGSCLSKDPCYPNNCPKGQRTYVSQRSLSAATTGRPTVLYVLPTLTELLWTTLVIVMLWEWCLTQALILHVPPLHAHPSQQVDAYQ
ncbi:Reversion-inducing cysteine-rich protein with Kazal motifs [Acipenser ruthenus]|uniref:Reversion-inducing cysteine-rich protein with Kazal motifs n=1 Tax=Acipenser ruthenus TaxID=7906 RepID=A0A662YLN5_ACIRT|nr:Reversion-inducing cysteine-rich protein with Kazal motifs [Acipenser ruthenus]